MTDLDAGGAYAFRVRAFGGDWSYEVSARLAAPAPGARPAAGAAPARPEDRKRGGDGGHCLAWEQGSAGASRCSGAGPGAPGMIRCRPSQGGARRA